MLNIKQHAEIMEQCKYTVMVCKYVGIGCDVWEHMSSMIRHTSSTLWSNYDLQSTPPIIASVVHDRLQSVTTITSLQKISAVFKITNYEKIKKLIIHNE